MHKSIQYLVSLIAAVLMLAALLWLHMVASQPLFPLVWLLFLALIIFTSIYGVPLSGGSLSLLPMATVTTFLVLGLEPAAWAAFLGAMLYGLAHYLILLPANERKEQGVLPAVSFSLANAAVQSASILVAGTAFHSLAGSDFLIETGLHSIPSLAILFLAYLGVNYLLAGLFLILLRHSTIRLYLRSLPRLFIFETGPLIFAPLAALIYNRMGMVWFLIYWLSLAAWSLIARRLGQARERLERRINELNSLHSVGKTLSASLDLDRILMEVYQQVSRLMPAKNFFIALYDQDTEEVSFPFVYEAGRRTYWRPHRLGSGLIDYVIHKHAPILIRDNFVQHIESLGIAPYGQRAQCWLGVPLMAGAQVHGVIGVQDEQKPNVYDENHSQMLTTIAAEAAVAIQNAYLYARTDQALAQRVRELNSILHTTREGILLMDHDRRVLAANRAVSDFVGLIESDFQGKKVKLYSKKGLSLASLGYTADSFHTVCEELAVGKGKTQVRMISLPTLPNNKFERTLAPVFGPERSIVGWLLVFRDITAEVELEQQREDMTNMLVHDLRSPLASLSSSLSLLEELAPANGNQDIDKLFTLARRGIERVLRLVNEILDIRRLENNQFPLHVETVVLRPFFEEVLSSISLLAGEYDLSLELQIDEDCPNWCFDQEQMARILNNLLDNALKFTPNGGQITIWSRGEKVMPGQRMLVIGVSDTGPGVPLEARERIFHKFGQVSTTKGRRRGTGLGLAYCRLAVEAHGGTIQVQSEDGHGSTFVIRLPERQPIEVVHE